MANLIFKAGPYEIVKDITGKNLMHVIKQLLPKEKLPTGFNFDDIIVKIGGEQVDLRTFDICKPFGCDVLITIAPKGIDPVSLAYIAAAVVIGLVAGALLAPAIPNQETAKDSPNNSFFGQTNTVRLDELEPNPYGFNVSYPDIITQEGGAWEYIDNKKIIKELFLMGIGSYEKGIPRYEKTPLRDIPGSEYYNYYEPSQPVPVVQGQFNSEFIDGQTLVGPNNDEVTGGTIAEASPIVGTMDISGGILSVEVNKNTEWDLIFTEFGLGIVLTTYEYSASMAIEGTFPQICAPTAQSSTGDILTMIDNGATYSITFDAQGAVTSSCSVQGYGTGFKCTEITNTTAQINVTLPKKTDELQISFDFRSGLRGGVSIAVFVSESTGVERYDFSYEADTINQLFFTEKIIISPPSGDLTVSLLRLNDDKTDNSDRIQVSQVATNTYRNNAQYEGVTLLETNRKATEQALKFKESKINLDCTRKTISYDLNTGQIISTLIASRSFADAILHEYTQVQGLSADDLPLDEMYTIAESLTAGLRNFDYTFADKQQSIKLRLELIANVARCQIPFYGDGYAIFRDEPKSPVIQFDSRNIDQRSSEEVSYRGSSATSNNGIKLKWKNTDNNKFEYVYYKINGANSVECIDQGGGVYLPALPTIPFEINLTGCSTIAQAKDRADLECRRLIYIQKTLKTTTLIDGENVTRGQVVKHVEYFEDDIDSGEIAEMNVAKTLFRSHSEFRQPPGSYFVTYTDDIGNVLGPIACTIIDKEYFSATMPDAYLADGYFIQCGTRFMISTIEQHEASLYVVADKKSDSSGNVSFELIEYNENIYPELD